MGGLFSKQRRKEYYVGRSHSTSAKEEFFGDMNGLPSQDASSSNPDIKISKHELHKLERAAVPQPPKSWSETINSNMDISSNWFHTKRAKTPEELAKQWEKETRHLPTKHGQPGLTYSNQIGNS